MTQEIDLQRQETLLRELEKARYLRDLLTQMNQTTGAARLFSLSIGGILRILKADRAAILTFDESGQLDFRASTRLSTEYCNKVRNHFPWPRDGKQVQPIHIEDIHQSDLDGELKRVIVEEGIVAVSFFPLYYDENLIGKFVVYNDYPRRLGKEEILTAMMIAESVSAALSRIRNRADLAESERQYRGIVENIAEGVYQSTPDGKFIMINRALIDILGYDNEEEVLQLDLPNQLYFHPTERERLAAEVDHKGRLRNVEVKLKRKDGSPVFVLMNDRVVRDALGNIVRYEGTLENISEHRRIEDALRAVASGVSALTGKAFFEALMEHLAQVLLADFAFCGQLVYKDDGPWIRTVAVYGDGKKVNNFEYVLAGSPCEKVILEGNRCYQESLQTLFPEDEILQDMAAESYMGLPLRGTNGSTLGLMGIINRRPMQEIDLAESIMNIFANRATAELERQIAEENQRQMEVRIQHEQKIKSVGLLAGGIAHEFNNILVGILGYADLAMMEIAENAAALHSLEKIKSAGQRAAELTRQLLAYSGQGKFVVEPLDLSGLIRNMSNLFQLAVPRKISIKFDLTEPLPLIEGDSKQMSQILLGLVSNASEAIKDNSGTILIKTSKTVADEQALAKTLIPENCKSGEYVILEISDTGEGMTPEVQARIFEPFYSTKFTGRGLGLSAVQGIVRSHHGTLRVDSEMGKGTRFRIYLPASHRQNAAKTETGANIPSGTVLLIDDEKDVRDIAGKILEREGLQVKCANDGLAGVAAFEAAPQSFSLVILDLMMPGLNGDEVYRRMTQIRPDIPVIFISGYSQQEAEQRFKTSGRQQFVQKPFTPVKLLETVRKVSDTNGRRTVFE